MTVYLLYLELQYMSSNLHRLLPIITRISNLSLSTGNSLFFPNTSLSLLFSRNPSVDNEILSGYRPVSNQPIIHLQIYWTHCPDSDQWLSDFQLTSWSKHKDTQLKPDSVVYLCRKLVSAIFYQQINCLCLLNISAAFHTNIILFICRNDDHNILLQRIQPDSVLMLLLSSVFNPVPTPLFLLSTSETSSHSRYPTCGVPQGPLFFDLFCSSFALFRSTHWSVA